MAERRIKGILIALLIISTLVTVCSFQCLFVHAANDEERLSFLGGQTLDEFSSGWDGVYTEKSSSTGRIVAATRYRAIDRETILYDIWGEGVCPSLAKKVSNTQKTILQIEKGFTSIKSYAFKGRTDIQSVMIPEGIKTIGEHAFDGCSSITEIVFPESLITLENNAFRECDSLEKIVLNSNLKEVGDCAFIWCTKLGECTFPEGLEKIGHDAFGQCGGFKNIILPDSIKEIGYQAFSGCTEIETLIIEGDNAIIGDDIVNRVPNLRELVIGDGVKKMGQLSLPKKNYKSLENVYMTTNAKYTNGGLFFESVPVKKTIYTGEGEIKADIGLEPETVIIQDNVTGIGNNAFYWDRKLKKLIVGAGVKRIGKQIIDDRIQLKMFQIRTKKLTKNSIKGCLYIAKKQKIQVRVGSKSMNKKYIHKYKKIFTKKNVGTKVTVK